MPQTTGVYDLDVQSYPLGGLQLLRGGRRATSQVHQDVSGSTEFEEDARFGEKPRTLKDGIDASPPPQLTHDAPHPVVPVYEAPSATARQVVSAEDVTAVPQSRQGPGSPLSSGRATRNVRAVVN